MGVVEELKVLVELLALGIAQILSRVLLAKAEEIVPTIAQAAVEDGTEEVKEQSVEAEVGLPIRTLRIQPRSPTLKVLAAAMAKYLLPI